MSKSPNKKTRLFVQAMPIEPDLAEAIEALNVGTRSFAIRARMFAKANGWDRDETQKIWCFGPDNIGSNILVDAMKGVHYMNEIKDGVGSGSQWCTTQGVC